MLSSKQKNFVDKFCAFLEQQEETHNHNVTKSFSHTNIFSHDSITLSLGQLIDARFLLNQLKLPINKVIKNYRCPLLISVDPESRDCIVWLYECLFEVCSTEQGRANLKKLESTINKLKVYQIMNTNSIITLLRSLEELYRVIYLEETPSTFVNKTLGARSLRLCECECPVVQYVLTLEGMFGTYIEVVKRLSGCDESLQKLKLLIRKLYQIVFKSSYTGNPQNTVNILLVSLITEKLKVKSEFPVETVSWLQNYIEDYMKNTGVNIDILSSFKNENISSTLLKTYFLRMKTFLKDEVNNKEHIPVTSV